MALSSTARWTITGVACLLTLFWPKPADASFAMRPYLQNLTATSIVVRWETPANQGGRVQYGPTTSYGSESSQGAPSTQHEITLSPLALDASYHYRVISDADTSADASFRTPVVGDEPFRFIAYGDDRSNHTDHQSVVNQMLLVDPPPGFLANVGDLTATGSTADYTTFFNIERDLLTRTALFPALGNHDTANMSNWYALLALPNNERWYSLRYGNAVLHVLDNYSSYTPGSAQYTWFLNELKADSADVSIRHIFVNLHQPPYTTNTGHSSDMQVRQYLCPLFERFGVRIVFNGHVHCYEHSLVNGVHYVISGGGGAPLYSGWGPVQPWTVYRETTLEFTLVDVRGDTVDVRSIKPGGAVIDPFLVVRPPSTTAVLPASPDFQPRLRVSPNPSTRRIQFDFELPAEGDLALDVVDAAGRRIAAVTVGRRSAGPQVVEWNAAHLPSGAYYARLVWQGQTRTVGFVQLR